MPHPDLGKAGEGKATLLRGWPRPQPRPSLAIEEATGPSLAVGEHITAKEENQKKKKEKKYVLSTLAPAVPHKTTDIHVSDTCQHD